MALDYIVTHNNLLCKSTVNAKKKNKKASPLL